MARDLFTLALELRRSDEPFALATVVRCEPPTSAKPGAKALIRGDGSVEGWVGGACAEPVVVREALDALRDGRPRLLSLVGDGNAARVEGLTPYPMTCHSGGTLEIYVEPFLPKARLVLIGHGPVVEVLAALARTADLPVAVLASEASGLDLRPALGGRDTAVVVATHGEADEAALEAVLNGEALYVSLIASRKRAGAVVERLRERGVPAARLDRLKAPAGLDIGAVAPEEIAISILAEIVQARRSRKPMEASAHEERPSEARDPVCGMMIPIASARYRSRAEGRVVYFCALVCKEAFDRDPLRYAAHPAG
jgi:xanthine dehydrogenase accessory factor